MAKSATNLDSSSVIVADGEPLDLRNRPLAAFLAWFIPGAGHAYQRRYLKSAIFSVSVFLCFFIGMVVSGYKCVYASWNQMETRWHYGLQVGVGLPALPAAYQAWVRRPGDEPALGGFMAAPRSEREWDEWHKSRGAGFDMGTLYTMVAGLLNLLAAFDAFAGPLPPPVNKHRRDSDGDSEGDPHASDKSSNNSSGGPQQESTGDANAEDVSGAGNAAKRRSGRKRSAKAGDR